MKTKWTLWALPTLLCLLLMASCNDKKVNHYVYEYVTKIDHRLGYTVNPHKTTNPIYEVNVNNDNGTTKNKLKIMLNRTESYTWDTKDKENKAQYMELAHKFNDFGWNNTVLEIDGVMLPREISVNVFMAIQVVDISVIAVSDWDEKKPAGSHLDDLFIFESWSPDQFIRNSYHLDQALIQQAIQQAPPMVDKKGLWNISKDVYNHTRTPIIGLLSEIKFEQYQLFGIDTSFWFELTSLQPVAPGKEIKIVIKLANGQEESYPHTFGSPQSDK